MPVKISKVPRVAMSCATLVLLVSMAGCSSGGSSTRSSGSSFGSSLFGSSNNACVSNPASCIHKGRYDADERVYAEREAARLNQLALEQLRRSSSK